MPYNKKYPVEGDYFIKYTENQEDRISNAIGEVEESMTSIDNVFIGTPLTSNSNLNDVKEVGSHYVPTSAIKNTIINAPVDLPNAGFRIDMFNNGANANIQVLTSFSPSNPVTYTRAFNNGNWGEWKRNSTTEIYNGEVRFLTGDLTDPAQSLAGVNYFRDIRTINYGVTFKKPPVISIQEETSVPHVVRATARNITESSVEIVTTRADKVSTGIIVSFIGEI